MTRQGGQEDGVMMETDELMVHLLKCWPGPFEAVASGQKRHEVRRFDRRYQSGDVVVLREWNPDREAYTGRVLAFLIGAVTRPGDWGLPPDVGAFTLLEPHP